jgi:carbon monoxide dehydrogenase subunit G
MELTNDFEVAVSLDEAWKVLTDVERIAPCLPGAQLQEVEGDEYRGIVKVKVGPITASYKGAASFLELDEMSHRAVLRAEGRETRGQGNASATITAMLAETASGGTKVSVVTDLNITGKVAQFGRGVLGDFSAKLLEQFVSNLETTVLTQGGEASPAVPQAKTGGGRARGSGDSTGDGSEPETAPAPAPSRPRRTRKAAAPKPPENDQGAEPAAAAATAEPAAATAEPATDETAGSAPADEPAASTATPRTPDEGGVRRIDHPEAQPVDLVDVAGPSLRRRILPYASIAGGIFLLRIVIYALRRRKK